MQILSVVSLLPVHGNACIVSTSTDLRTYTHSWWAVSGRNDWSQVEQCVPQSTTRGAEWAVLPTGIPTENPAPENCQQSVNMVWLTATLKNQLTARGPMHL
eukprot:10321213-Ditylum_brightwellii.AAC.1